MSRWKRGSLGVLGIVIALGIFFIVSPWPTKALASITTVDEVPQAADVVIVLGAGTRRGPVSLPPQAMDRLRKAKTLWDADLAPTIIVAGGFSRKTDRVESKYMKPFLASLGVPTESIVEENQSLDTYQNAVNSLVLMKKNGWDSAVVVTSQYHTYRSCKIFRKLQIDVTCVAAPLDDHGSIRERLLNLRSVFREYGAILYYQLKGYI